jgi:hypothetical protein
MSDADLRGTGMDRPDNPQAFPQFDYGNHGAGMTLRDWFAGQALTGFLAGDECEKRSYPQEAAFEAYQYADAMLSHRQGETK